MMKFLDCDIYRNLMSLSQASDSVIEKGLSDIDGYDAIFEEYKRKCHYILSNDCLESLNALRRTPRPQKNRQRLKDLFEPFIRSKVHLHPEKLLKGGSIAESVKSPLNLEKNVGSMSSLSHNISGDICNSSSGLNVTQAQTNSNYNLAVSSNERNIVEHIQCDIIENQNNPKSMHEKQVSDSNVQVTTIGTFKNQRTNDSDAQLNRNDCVNFQFGDTDIETPRQIENELAPQILQSKDVKCINSVKCRKGNSNDVKENNIQLANSLGNNYMEWDSIQPHDTNQPNSGFLKSGNIPESNGLAEEGLNVSPKYSSRMCCLYNKTSGDFSNSDACKLSCNGSNINNLSPSCIRKNWEKINEIVKCQYETICDSGADIQPMDKNGNINLDKKMNETFTVSPKQNLDPENGENLQQKDATKISLCKRYSGEKSNESSILVCNQRLRKPTYVLKSRENLPNDEKCKSQRILNFERDKSLSSTSSEKNDVSSKLYSDWDLKSKKHKITHQQKFLKINYASSKSNETHFQKENWRNCGIKVWSKERKEKWVNKQASRDKFAEKNLREEASRYLNNVHCTKAISFGNHSLSKLERKRSPRYQMRSKTKLPKLNRSDPPADALFKVLAPQRPSLKKKANEKKRSKRKLPKLTRPDTPADAMFQILVPKRPSLKEKADEKKKLREERMQKTKERRELLEKKKEEKIRLSEQKLKLRFQQHEEMLKKRMEEVKIKSRARHLSKITRNAASSSDSGSSLSKGPVVDNLNYNSDVNRQSSSDAKNLSKEEKKVFLGQISTNGSGNFKPLVREGEFGMSPKISVEQNAILTDSAKTSTDSPLKNSSPTSVAVARTSRNNSSGFKSGNRGRKRIAEETLDSEEGVRSGGNFEGQSAGLEQKEVAQMGDLDGSALSTKNNRSVKKTKTDSKSVSNIPQAERKTTSRKKLFAAVDKNMSAQEKKGRLLRSNTKKIHQKTTKISQTRQKKDLEHPIINCSNVQEYHTPTSGNLNNKQTKNTHYRKVKPGVSKTTSRKKNIPMTIKAPKTHLTDIYTIKTRSKDYSSATSIQKTPQKTPKTSSKKKRSQNSEIISYKISDLTEGSYIEEKMDPKKIPLWASGVYLKQALFQQHYKHPNFADIFGVVPKTIDLAQVFDIDKPQYHRRTSSDKWSNNTSPA